jgi:beta-glucosidase
VANVTGDTPAHLGDYYSGGGSGHVEAGAVVKTLDGLRRRMFHGQSLFASPTDDVEHALVVASKADVTIVVVGTTSGEGSDRPNLLLDNNVDTLISEVSKVAKRTVVLAQIPGAVLTPWRDSVDAIAVQFLGGEATGAAWGNIIFGLDSPAGRLPITLPLDEQDVIEPSQDLRIKYSEGLRTGYRAGQHAAFPFGHGLSYGRFELEGTTRVACRDDESLACLETTVQNGGSRSAVAVVQLYLKRSIDAPLKVLKGFRRTEIIPAGGKQQVRFDLGKNELRYYDPKLHTWSTSAAMAGATAHLGFSATDLREAVSLDPETIVV